MRGYRRGWCGLSWLGLALLGLGAEAVGAEATVPLPVPNSGFEEWEPLAAPLAGWDLGAGHSCPQGWVPQERPDERGICAAWSTHRQTVSALAKPTSSSMAVS